MTQESGTNQPAYYSQFDHVWPLEIISIVGRFNKMIRLIKIKRLRLVSVYTMSYQVISHFV